MLFVNKTKGSKARPPCSPEPGVDFRRELVRHGPQADWGPPERLQEVRFPGPPDLRVQERHQHFHPESEGRGGGAGQPPPEGRARRELDVERVVVGRGRDAAKEAQQGRVGEEEEGKEDQEKVKEEEEEEGGGGQFGFGLRLGFRNRI